MSEHGYHRYNYGGENDPRYDAECNHASSVCEQESAGYCGGDDKPCVMSLHRTP